LEWTKGEERLPRGVRSSSFEGGGLRKP
jgi:hypothetical protein